MVIEEGDLVTIPEAARLLRVSASTVRRMIDRGEVPSHRVGRRNVRLSRHELGRGLGERSYVRQLTLAEREARGQALERARELRQRDIVRRGGVPWPTDVDDINAGRDERLIDQRLDLR